MTDRNLYLLSETSFLAVVRKAARCTVSALSSPTIDATLFLMSASPGTTPVPIINTLPANQLNTLHPELFFKSD